MKSQVLSRASGPTLYQPSVLPRDSQVGELHVAPGADLFADVLEVVLVVDVVEDLPALAVHRPQNAVVEVQGPVLADQAEVVATGTAAKPSMRAVLALWIGLEEVQGALGPLDHRVGVERGGALEEGVALRDGQVLVDAARDGTGAVDLLAGRGQDDLLPELAQQDPLDGEVPVLEGDADDVPDGRVGVHAEEQVGRDEVEEMQGVGLEHLAVVHEPPHLLGRRREPVGADADDDVHRLGGRQVVAHRADAAEPLDEDRRLPVGAALDEPLEAAELDDVEPRLGDLAVVVELDGDLAVALDSGDGFYRDLSCHERCPSIEFDDFVRRGRSAFPRGGPSGPPR